MKTLIVLISWITGVVGTSSSACPRLPDPIGGERDGVHVDVVAGNLTLSWEGDELRAVKMCDEERGWMEWTEEEFRCSWNTAQGRYLWDHYNHRNGGPPAIRCAAVSPLPITMTWQSDGCEDSARFLESAREMECALTGECMVTVECDPDVLSVTLESTAREHVTQQRARLESIAVLLESLASHDLEKRSSGSRVKRDEFSTPTDTSASSCGDGEIEVTNDNSEIEKVCISCPVGTYESDDTTCSPCELDSYNAATKQTTCTACDGSLGTLDTGSDDVAACVVVCVVPEVKLASLDPAKDARVVDGSTVTATCDTDYIYGPLSTFTFTCGGANLPTMCRSFQPTTISTNSVVAGQTAELECVMKWNVAATSIKWYKVVQEDAVMELSTDPGVIELATTDGSPEDVTSNGVVATFSHVQTTKLTIYNFADANVGHYYCNVDYDGNYDAQKSAESEITLAILNLAKTPSDASLVMEAGDVLAALTCTLNLDHTYSSRSVTWKKEDKVLDSGFTNTVDEDVENFVLSFPVVALSDDGIYGCAATYNKADGSHPQTLSATWAVTVRGYETQPTAENIKAVGEALTLVCKAVGGDAATTLSWYKKANPEDTLLMTVTAHDSDSTVTASLIYTALSEDNDGSYYCRADYDGDIIDSDDALITLYDYTITVDGTEVAVKEEENAVLKCTVDSPPEHEHPPTVDWYRVTSEGTLELLEQASESYVSNSYPDEKLPVLNAQLTVMSVTAEDVGEYRCGARYTVPAYIEIKPAETITLSMIGGAMSSQLLAPDKHHVSLVELTVGEETGILCDDGWSASDAAASVVCQEHGYKKGKAYKVMTHREDYVATQLSCPCSDQALATCSYLSHATADLQCRRGDAAGVVCYNDSFEYRTVLARQRQTKEKYTKFTFFITGLRFGSAVNRKDMQGLALDPSKIKVLIGSSSELKDVLVIKMKVTVKKFFIRLQIVLESNEDFAKDCLHLKYEGKFPFTEEICPTEE